MSGMVKRETTGGGRGGGGHVQAAQPLHLPPPLDISVAVLFVNLVTVFRLLLLETQEEKSFVQQRKENFLQKLTSKELCCVKRILVKLTQQHAAILKHA